MTVQVRISARTLGAVALPDFCRRCFWIRLRVNNKLPFQIFPGIFSSIDSYNKRIVHLGFSANIIPVSRDEGKLRPLFAKTREIHDLASTPAGRPGCKACGLLEQPIDAAGT